jgi:hypothetical protein
MELGSIRNKSNGVDAAVVGTNPPINDEGSREMPSTSTEKASFYSTASNMISFVLSTNHSNMLRNEAHNRQNNSEDMKTSGRRNKNNVSPSTFLGIHTQHNGVILLPSVSENRYANDILTGRKLGHEILWDEELPGYEVLYQRIETQAGNFCKYRNVVGVEALLTDNGRFIDLQASVHRLQLKKLPYTLIAPIYVSQ